MKKIVLGSIALFAALAMVGVARIDDVGTRSRGGRLRRTLRRMTAAAAILGLAACGAQVPMNQPLPITESGCAGGVVGLARARDYLAAHPERSALRSG